MGSAVQPLQLAAEGRSLYARPLEMTSAYLGSVVTPDLAAEVARRFNAFPPLLEAVRLACVRGEPGDLIALDAAYQRARGVEGTEPRR